MLRSYVAAALLAALAFGVYLPVRDHVFVEFDDPLYVTSNAHVQQGLTASNLVWAFTTGDAYIWHPLTWLSYLLDSELHGTARAGPWLLTNAVLHALNAALLLLLLCSLRRASEASSAQPGRVAEQIWPCAFAAALFALHPIQVESVAWVSARKELLAAGFLLLTLHAYVAWALRGGGLRYASVLIAMSLCLAAKGSHIGLPLLLLGLDAWPLGRLRFDDGWRWPAGGWPLLREKLPLLALSLASVAINHALLAKAYSFWASDPPLLARVGSALVALVGYLGRILWPSGLAIAYPNPLQAGVPAWSLARIAASLALLVAISLLAARAGRRRGYLPLGWLWFVVMLLPMLGLIPMGLRTPHDRYAYVPMIGLALGFAFALGELAARGRASRALALALAVIVSLACAVTTRQQIQVWRDSITLFDHALEVTAGNAVAYYSKGVHLMRVGRSDAALQEFEAALRYQPQHPDANNNIGYLLVQRGEIDRGIAHLERALAARPDWPRALSNLGQARLRNGELEAAIASLERAVALAPQLASAQHALAMALLEAGRREEAAEALRATLRIDPDHAAARMALTLLGDIGERSPQ